MTTLVGVTYDDYLAHYGVKGMKWGVRKDRDTQKKSKTPSEGYYRDKAKYINKGLSDEEASIKAARRQKVKKVMLVAGGVALTAATAYVATNEYKKRFQGVDLPMGAYLKNVNRFGEDMNYDRRAYVTIKEKDSKKYRGMYAQQLRLQEYFDSSSDSKIFETTLTTKERIKAPSHNQAKKLYKEFRENELKNNPNNSLNIPKRYNMFNANLVATGAYGEETDYNKRFYSFVKKKGYNAILDANDQFISGYNTEKPLIVFNAASSASVKAHNLIEKHESEKLMARQMQISMAKTLAKNGAFFASIKAANNIAKNKNKKKAIDTYFEDHPTSSKTREEVYAMLERGELDDQNY